MGVLAAVSTSGGLTEEPQQLDRQREHDRRVLLGGDVSQRLQVAQRDRRRFAVENALRADEPRPSLPAEIALKSAPEADMGGFRVPSPGPAPA